MFQLKACSRCGGDFYQEAETVKGGQIIENVCLQCGARFPLSYKTPALGITVGKRGPMIKIAGVSYKC